MTDVEPVVTDFAATGRTGRRNAMPDILGANTGDGATDLQEKLAELSVSDDGNEGGEGSSSCNPPKEEKKEEGS
ncbi:cAMP-dependent protein kinase inhibitor beta [Sardina pilchardus]|uniref:cAMP-dependent protein kinase inhibitor beta n=1 Tax=Sardina pilchardus TaxID=27697 RepID=UPI002E0EF777